MPEDLDINRVIRSGSRQMDVDELAKLGHKKVRVIDENRIRELITQAVQKTIERETTDVAGRERRQAAEKAKQDIEARLAEYKTQLEHGELASKEVDRLKGEVFSLQGQLGQTRDVIEAEKKRIAEESQREFQRLLRDAKQEVEAKRGAYEQALREMIQRANEAIPRDEKNELPVIALGETVEATELLDALNRRIEVLNRLVESAQTDLSSRDQDIALAAAEHRRQEMEVTRLRAEVDKLRQEVRDKERQIDAREQDVTLAALEQRRFREEVKHLREEAARAAAQDGEVRRLNAERDLLLARIADYHEKEAAAGEQLSHMAGKLSAIEGATSKGTADLQEAIGTMKGSIGEEIARQVAWALSAQKTGATGIDPGLQLEALFSQEIETNIESVKIEERTGKILAEKLAKLRRARGGGTDDSAGGDES